MITKTASARTYVAIGGLLVLGGLFAALGAWQLGRAETSRATRAQFDSGVTDTVLAALPSSLESADRFRRLEIGGEYIARPQFLLDNMLHDGVAGYHVVTALRIPGRRERLLVNRGWVPAGGDRRVLPDVEVGGASRAVSGRLERLPRPGLRLGAEGGTAAPADVVVLQYPTAHGLAELLGEPVLDYQLLLDAGMPDGFVREWRAPAAVVMTFRTLRRKR